MLFDEGFCNFGIVYVDRISGIRSPSNGYYADHAPYDGLWLASPSTKFEMDQYYFSNTKFVLRSPQCLSIFADQLSAYQWSLLREVTLHLGYDDSLRDWMSACARVPPNLISIQFIILNWNMRTAKIHGQWFIIPAGNGGANVEMLDRAVVLVNTLGKMAHRVAAKAKISLGVDELEVEERNTHRRVLDNLDPWSKEYMSWWEEETKIDFDGGETFNKAAWYGGNPWVRCD